MDFIGITIVIFAAYAVGFYIGGTVNERWGDK